MVGGSDVVKVLGRSAFHDTSLICDGDLAYLGGSWSKTVGCAVSLSCPSEHRLVHIHTYICMYVCMYVYMYICMYVCMYICIYVYMYVCILIYSQR